MFEIRNIYSPIVLVDGGAHMNLIDKLLAERIGVEYTGRKADFSHISGPATLLRDWIAISRIETEGKVLKYELLVVIVESLNEVLKSAIYKFYVKSSATKYALMKRVQN